MSAKAALLGVGGAGHTAHKEVKVMKMECRWDMAPLALREYFDKAQTGKIEKSCRRPIP